jgi:hypothetical protein
MGALSLKESLICERREKGHGFENPKDRENSGPESAGEQSKHQDQPETFAE